MKFIQIYLVQGTTESFSYNSVQFVQLWFSFNVSVTIVQDTGFHSVSKPSKPLITFINGLIAYKYLQSTLNTILIVSLDSTGSK